MQFEFDPEKSASNRIKHGIDFVVAQALWDDPMLLVAPARSTDEERYLAVGLIGDRHWSAIYTVRGDHIRLISVRRSREMEIGYYEGR